jgi:hypothetical protein
VIPVFKGLITDGKIIHDTPAKFQAYLERLEGKHIEITVRKQRSQRSLNQNSYYFGVVVKLLSTETGYEEEEIHDILKYQFLKIGGSDGEFERVRSTSALSTSDFEEYLEKIRRWSAGVLGIVIPLPNEAENTIY